MVKPVLGDAANDRRNPGVATDIRKVLEDKSITAVVVSAPDHWHALATIWAAERGKHVYVEKPVSHNLIEGRRMVDAARKYKVVIQAGTQRRSSGERDRGSRIRAGRQARQGGVRPRLDRRATARTSGTRSRSRCRRASITTSGSGRRRATFTKNRFHYNWHWFWDLGTGEIGNNGIHGWTRPATSSASTRPTKISCAGGKYYYDDDQQTPDTQIATFDFPTGPGGAAGCTVLWEHRVWEKKGQGPEDQSYGIAIHGDKGTLLFEGDGWKVRGGDGATEKPKGDIVGDARPKNFIASDSRRRQAERRDRGRPQEHAAVPPREHRVPHGQDDPVRREDRDDRRPGREQAARPRVSQGL